MFKVSACDPEPTNATLRELSDQLAPLPFSVPASTTSPGASMASAPPEATVAPRSTSMVADAAPLDAGRLTTGNATSETESNAGEASALATASVTEEYGWLVRYAVSSIGRLCSTVPLLPDVDISAAPDWTSIEC